VHHQSLVCVRLQGQRIVLRRSISPSATATTAAAQMTPQFALPAVGKWGWVTLVVDCLDGTVEVFVNGKAAGAKLLLLTTGVDSKATTDEGRLSELDGAWSLGPQFTLFCSRDSAENQDGGCIRYGLWYCMYIIVVPQ
jgi:hypothetical protein